MSLVVRKTYYIGYWLFAFLVCYPVVLQAQLSRTALEERKKKRVEEIQKMQKMLQEIASMKSTKLSSLQLVSRQVEAREAYILLLMAELSSVRGDIDELSAIYLSLQKDLNSMEEEYTDLAYWRQKNASGISQLTFIFSSNTFREFLLRAQYIHQFSELRKVQLEAIKGVQLALGGHRKKLKVRKMDQEEILQKEKKEKEKLVALKRQRTALIKALSKKERILKLELEKERKALKELNTLISQLVSRAKVAVPAAVELSYSDLSKRFLRNKKRIPWPINGVVVSKFGRQKHPVLKGVEIDNHGVVIQTTAKEVVRAVFSGVAVTIAYVPGMNNVVIVRHGDYYTLYARLAKVYVKSGQQVAQGEEVGVVFTDEKGTSQLQFQVWKEANKLNPEDWLSS